MLKKSLILATFIVTAVTAKVPVSAQEAGYVHAAVHNLCYASLCAYGFKDNFRIGVPGVLYRANTLPPESLAKYIDEYGIKSVVNLRGKLSDAQWWQDENTVTQEHGAAMYNVELLAHEYPPPKELERLLEIFDTAQQPLMVHCFAGVDRTGTASALWFLEKEGRTLKEALKQLSFLYYGHWGLVYSNTMRRFVKMWHELRARYDRNDALVAYTAIYEERDLKHKGREHLYHKPLRSARRSFRYPVFGLLNWKLAGKLRKHVA